MADQPELIFVGLTATPGRAGMKGEWDDLVVGATTKQLIDLGFLSQFEAVRSLTAEANDAATPSGSRTKPRETGSATQVSLVPLTEAGSTG
jgi:superfamily II DNA or RNA helicase